MESMDPKELSIGDMIDLTLLLDSENTYIVGEVLGIRQQYFNPDGISVLIAGIDVWLDLDLDKTVVRLADV